MPSWLSSGKFRASLAGIGKDALPYSTAINYVPDGLPINQVTLWTRNNASGVHDLKPEFTTTYEVGTDLSFLKDRLGLSFTWYHSVSKDQILAVQTAASTGFTTITLNAGAIQNKGVELSVNATPVKSSNFSWDIAVNFSANRNKVLSIYRGLNSLVVGSEYGYAGASPTFEYVVGQPVSDIFGTYYLRYYGNGKTGDPLFTDKSKPMVINDTYLTDSTTNWTTYGFPEEGPGVKILGNSQPKWNGSINNSLTYKNWNLSFLIDTRQGIQKYNQLDNWMAAFGIAKYTENRNETITFPGVYSDGTVNAIPVWLGQGVGPDGHDYVAGYYRNNYRGVTENFVQDANWVRLRSLSLSYNLPQKWLKRSFITRANVGFTGYNLWLSTPYNGFDPEASDVASGDPTASMMAGFTYPANRSYSFSLNVTF